MDVIEVLEDVRKRLSELEGQRDALEAQRLGVVQRIAAISSEIREAEEGERVLRRVAAQYDLPVPQDGLLPREVREWQELARTDAIMRVLHEIDEPLSPAEIAQALVARGRDDPAHHVSAALAHLKNSGRVRQVARGQWVRADSELPGLRTELLRGQLNESLRRDEDAT
jgi:hypothetical protein